MATEGKFVDLKDVENVEQYDAIFSVRGDKKIKPTALFEALELPENLHYEFTISPLNPVDRERLVEMNRKGNVVYRKSVEDLYSKLIEKVFHDVEDVKHDIKELAAKETLSVEETEKLEGLLERKQKHDNDISKAWRQRRSTEDYELMMELIEKYTSNVDKLLVINKGKRQQYTGNVDMNIIAIIPPEIREWIFDEIEKASLLSTVERLGL